MLTDEELRDALRSCPPDAVEALRVRWLYVKDFGRAVEAAAIEKLLKDAGEPYVWRAIGGSIWNHKTSEDDRALYTAEQVAAAVVKRDTALRVALEALKIDQIDGVTFTEEEAINAAIKKIQEVLHA